MGNMVPESAPRILKRTREKLKVRANSKGECFGGEIVDCLREAGVALGANHFEILQIKSLLVRVMESFGEASPAEILQDYENRIQLSQALRFLNEAIDATTRHRAP